MELQVFPDSFTLTFTSGLEKFFGGLDNNVVRSGKRLYLAKFANVLRDFQFFFTILVT